MSINVETDVKRPQLIGVSSVIKVITGVALLAVTVSVGGYLVDAMTTYTPYVVG